MNQIIDKILIAGAFLAFFLAALLINKKDKAGHDYLLGLWLVFLGLYVAVYTVVPAGFFRNNPLFLSFYISLLLLNGPILFRYVNVLIRKPVNTYLTGHLIPFILFNFYTFLFLSPADVQKIIYTSENVFSNVKSVFFVLLLLMVAISAPYYIIRSIYLLRRHRKNVKNTYSSLEKRNLLWLRNLIGIFGISWSVIMIIFFLHHVLHLFSDNFCINGLYLTLSGFIIVTGYYGLHQPAIFVSGNSFQVKAEEPVKYSGFVLREEDVNKYMKSLDEAMKVRKVFLNSEITLAELSESTDIPAHHLSRIINEHYHQNFFEFVNTFRVEEFKKRLSDPRYKNFTFLAIALDCGFNSKAAFNRFFKKVTGFTPSEYKNTL